MDGDREIRAALEQHWTASAAGDHRSVRAELMIDTYSPLLSWLYGPLSVRGFSALLGVVEVATAIHATTTARP